MSTSSLNFALYLQPLKIQEFRSYFKLRPTLQEIWIQLRQEYHQGVKMKSGLRFYQLLPRRTKSGNKKFRISGVRDFEIGPRMGHMQMVYEGDFKYFLN